MTITPLDTCGIVHLKGEKYQKVLKRNSPLTRALMENYRAWYTQPIANKNKDLSEAVLAVRVNQKVTDDGYTRIDEGGKLINCATEWKDLGAFEDFLVKRLTK